MAWVVPTFSRNQVDKAGRIIASTIEDPSKFAEALSIVSNWRASHTYPLNTFQVTLRNKARKSSNVVFVSQRIKRLESVIRKLSSGSMQLSRMQDIGVCRAVLERAEDIPKLRHLYEKAEFAHEFRNAKDYILLPKDDGYRSLHLIYKYKGTINTTSYDGLQIELQIRSQMQHAWATAVEAVGIFTKQALKWRGGDADWQRYFALMSAGIANLEKSAPVPCVPSSRKLIGKEIRELERSLQVRQALRAYSMTLDYVGQLHRSEAKLLLVHMLPNEGRVEVEGFRLRDSQVANERYTKLESSIPSESASQAVLVRVDSVQALQRAYPNYFLDTARFSEVMDEVIRWS